MASTTRTTSTASTGGTGGPGMIASVDVTDNATAFLRRLVAVGGDPRDLLMVTSEAVAALIREHLRGLSATNRNKMGAPSSQFWVNQMQLVSAEVTPTQALVSIPRETMQRRFGGRITPGPGKNWLTLPANRESYGKTADEFDDLRFAGWHDNGRYYAALMQKATNKVFFWLRKFVDQDADESILPTDDEILQASTESIGDFLMGLEAAS